MAARMKSGYELFYSTNYIEKQPNSSHCLLSSTSFKEEEEAKEEDEALTRLSLPLPPLPPPPPPPPPSILTYGNGSISNEVWEIRRKNKDKGGALINPSPLPYPHPYSPILAHPFNVESARSSAGRPYNRRGRVPRCHVDGCEADLGAAKGYHRKHRVCEIHSKAPKVILAGGGLEQRFCQQCSRFHALSEFDDTKRSCRKRLEGHNERRRKSSRQPYIAADSLLAAPPTNLACHGATILLSNPSCYPPLSSSYSSPEISDFVGCALSLLSSSDSLLPPSHGIFSDLDCKYLLEQLPLQKFNGSFDKTVKREHKMNDDSLNGIFQFQGGQSYHHHHHYHHQQ